MTTPSKSTSVAIMAGGIGTRFWPRSRVSLPKQFLDILGTGKTLLQNTYNRFSKIIPANQIYIITHERYAGIVKQQLPGITDDQLLLEPVRRNTAPCIHYAATKLHQKDPNTIMVVAPADHLIMEEDSFQESILNGIEFSDQMDALLTLGIRPTRPDTNYGYIQYKDDESDIKRVKTFTEKPNIDLARKFLSSGDFLWNSGIFIWSTASFIDAMKKNEFEVYDAFDTDEKVYFTDKEKKHVRDAYSRCRSISVDYAVLEKADNVFVLPADFEWSDLGTWTSLWDRHTKDYFGNAVTGKKVMIYESHNNLIDVPDEKLVILQGLKDYFIVDTNDALVICKKGEEQKIKEFIADAKRISGDKFL